MCNFSISQDTFIGFGGNVVREKVKSQAPWFVTDFKELLRELQPSQNGMLAKETGLLNGVNGKATEHLLNGVNGKETHLNGVNGKETHINGVNGKEQHLNGTIY